MTDTKSPRIPVLFCIDVEPDPRFVNRSAPEPWAGYEFLQRHLSELRPRIEEETGSPVRFCWFFRLDPAVAEAYGSATFALDRYPKFIEEIEGRGDELGIHTHTHRWLEEKQTWVHDFTREWADQCIGTSVEAFAQALGRRCVSSRFGDRWLSTEAVNLLERLGVRFEFTVEPGADPDRSREPGHPEEPRFLPQFYRVPRVPYVPSKSDFHKPAPNGSRSIRIIPLTSTYFVGLPLRSRLRRLLLNGVRYRHQDTPLQMWRHRKAPNAFESLIDRALAAQEKPYLATVVRSDVGSDRKFFKGFDSSLRALLSHPARSRFVFTTPAQALQMLGYTDERNAEAREATAQSGA